MSFTTTMKINGVDHIKQDLARFPNDAPKIYGDAVQKAASRLRDETKSLGEIPVNTGRMRQSINSRRIQQLAAGVFGGTDYALYVHEGTPTMKPRPFLDWALKGGAQKAIDDIFAAAMKLLPK